MDEKRSKPDAQPAQQTRHQGHDAEKDEGGEQAQAQWSRGLGRNTSGAPFGPSGVGVAQVIG